jgi:hypothetical protein
MRHRLWHSRRPADAAVPKVPGENGKNHVRNRLLFFDNIMSHLYIFSVDKELPATAFGQFNLPQPTTTTTITMRPTIASAANENVVNSNQARTNAIMTPRDPVPNAPGAFAVNGPNDVPGGQDNDNFTYTGQDDMNVDNNIHAAPVNSVEAWLVDNSKYSVRCVLQFKQNVVNAIIGQPRNRRNTRVCQDSLSTVDSLVKHYKTNCWRILTLDITHYLIYSLFLKLFIILQIQWLNCRILDRKIMGVFQSFFKRHDYYKFHSIAMLPFVPCVAAILWNALDVLVPRSG